MLPGRNHIDSIALNGEIFHLIVVHYVDPVRIYNIQVIRGDWNSANPQIIAATLVDETKQDRTPEERLKQCIESLNKQLREKMAPVTTIPETWVEKLEYLIMKLFFRISENIIQIDIKE